MSTEVFLVMDTETGDLSTKEGDLLTLYAAICTPDFKIIDELDLRLKPNDRLPRANARALEVNKIDLKKHVESPETITYSEGKKKLVALLLKHRKKTGRYIGTTLLGQNVGFDKRFVFEYLIPESEWNDLVSYNDEDTKSATLFLKRCGWLPPDVGTLGSLVEFFNIPKRAAHEAKGDVLMTIDVYKALIALLESKKDGGTSQDLVSLLESE